MTIIQKDSKSWKSFLQRLSCSNEESLSEFLCETCWKFYSRHSKKEHDKKHPDHSLKVVNTRDLSGEKNFFSFANALGKVEEKDNRTIIQLPK